MEFAKLTGETLEGKDNYWLVKFRTGECLHVPIMANILGSVPSKEWLSANKDNFLAVVAFEDNNRENPLLIDLYPTKEAKSSTFNVFERLLAVNKALLTQLLKAKTNTQIGPQPFMPDTIQVLKDLDKEVDEITKLIYPL